MECRAMRFTSPGDRRVNACPVGTGVALSRPGFTRPRRREIILGPFYYGAPYGYGLGYGYWGWGGGRVGRLHRGRYYYDPFYDPFFYSHANIVRYPERTVSFEDGPRDRFPIPPGPRVFFE